MPRERVGEYALYHSYYIRFPKFLQSGDYEIVAPFPQCWPEEHRQFQQEDFLKLFGPDEGFPLNLFGRLRSQDREQKQKAKEKEANLKDQTDDEVDPLTEEQKLSDAE